MNMQMIDIDINSDEPYDLYQNGLKIMKIGLSSPLYIKRLNYNISFFYIRAIRWFHSRIFGYLEVKIHETRPEAQVYTNLYNM